MKKTILYAIAVLLAVAVSVKAANNPNSKSLSGQSSQVKPDVLDGEPAEITELRKSILEGPHGKRDIREVVDDFASAEGSRLEELYPVLAVRKQEAVPTVLEKLKTGTVAEKRKMTKLLRQTRWPEAVPKLLEMATSDKEHEISRIGALYSLGAIGNRAIAARIAEQLDKAGRSTTENRVIISTLARLKYKPAIQKIEKYVDANDPLLRIFAARAIAELDDRTHTDMIAVLDPLLGSDDYLVRREACSALGSCNTAADRSLLGAIASSDPDSSVREEAGLAILRIDIRNASNAERIGLLEQATKGKNEHIRLWVISELVSEEGPEGKRIIEKILQDSSHVSKNIATRQLILRSE
jgi:HEAT repeat protein